MKRADIHLTNKAMNKKKYSLLLLLAALLLLPVAANAQKDLKIQEVFQRYGKNRNVTMVELSNEMLETYANSAPKAMETLESGFDDVSLDWCHAHGAG